MAPSIRIPNGVAFPSGHPAGVDRRHNGFSSPCIPTGTPEASTIPTPAVCFRGPGGAGTIAGMGPHYWHTIAESNFPWERDALEFIRQRLPDREPYRAWSNFEFIADDGSINEVDLLVLTPAGFFLIEIKSRPGILRGDAGTWTWEHERRLVTDDNPVFAANRKAKKLKSLLEKQKAIKNLKGRLPFLETLVFCSAPGLDLKLEGTARCRVCLRDRDAAGEQPARPGIIAALERRDCVGLDAQAKGQGDRAVAKAISQALTVRNLLAFKPRRLSRLRGVGNKTRREITDALKILRPRLGVQAEAAPPTTLVGPEALHGEAEPTVLSVDLLARHVTRSDPRARNDTERRFLAAFLGLDLELPDPWPSQTDVAVHLGVSRGRVGQQASTAQERWNRDPSLTRLRADILDILMTAQGVMAIDELAAAVLMARGSVEDEPHRSRLAIAVTRAAVEVERVMPDSRLVVRRDRDRVLVAVSQPGPTMRSAWAMRPMIWPRKTRWSRRPACWNDCGPCARQRASNRFPMPGSFAWLLPAARPAPSPASRKSTPEAWTALGH